MAPIIGLKRAELLALLRQAHPEKALPIHLNWMGPAGIVLREEGLWRLRALSCNDAAAEAEHQKRIADGDPQWMPEHTWPFYEPAELLIEAGELDQFITDIELMDWPFTPDDFDTGEATESPLGHLMRKLKGQ